MTDITQFTDHELYLETKRRERQALIDARASAKCRSCGYTESETNWPLIDFEVIMAHGEEGHSHIRTQFCEYCLDIVQSNLEKLNLTVHAHGGICYLEDMDCPGATDMDECPSPEPQYVE